MPDPAPGTEVSQSPLNANYFSDALAASNLTSLYPNLVHKIRHGFDIGKRMPTLFNTHIPRNHARSDEDCEIIERYYDDEIQLGRMVGPMSVDDAVAFASGHFVTSPIGLVPKPDSDKKRIVRDMSFKYTDGSSINGHIEKDDYTCRWTTSQTFADWVSGCSFYFHFHFLCFPICTMVCMDTYQHDAVDAYRPEAVGDTHRPDAVEVACRPEAVGDTHRPDAVDAYRLEAVGDSHRPDAVEVACRPEAVGDIPTDLMRWMPTGLRRWGIPTDLMRWRIPTCVMRWKAVTATRIDS